MQVNEEGNQLKNLKLEITFKPMEELEDKSPILKKRSVNYMADYVIWVQTFTPKLEHSKVYRNARIAFAKNIEKFSEKQAKNPEKKLKR